MTLVLEISLALFLLNLLPTPLKISPKLCASNHAASLFLRCNKANLHEKHTVSEQVSSDNLISYLLYAFIQTHCA